MASPTLSYISSVGVLSTLLASPIGRYFSKRRFFPEYTLCPTGEKPGDIIRLFGDEENTCPGQLPGYFYLLFLTGGSHLVISQPHYISNLNLSIMSSVHYPYIQSAVMIKINMNLSSCLL